MVTIVSTNSIMCAVLCSRRSNGEHLKLAILGVFVMVLLMPTTRAIDTYCYGINYSHHALRNSFVEIFSVS